MKRRMTKAGRRRRLLAHAEVAAMALGFVAIWCMAAVGSVVGLFYLLVALSGGLS